MEIASTDVALVPDGSCTSNLQTWPDTRSCQDIVHALEHGLTGRYPQDRGKLSIIWQNVPDRSEHLFNFTEHKVSSANRTFFFFFFFNRDMISSIFSFCSPVVTMWPSIIAS
jgi:hypothetical protein